MRPACHLVLQKRSYTPIHVLSARGSSWHFQLPFFVTKMAGYLPPHNGLLPLWLLLVSPPTQRGRKPHQPTESHSCQLATSGFGNSIQTYTTLSYTRRVYAGRPPPKKSPSNSVTATTTIAQSTKPATDPAESRRPSIESVVRADAELSTSSSSPVTPLSARTFGAWTFLVSVARLYAAYHIHEPAWYQMALLANLVALSHFMAECFVYKTCTPYGPWLAPTSIAAISSIWMLSQYSFYVK